MTKLSETTYGQQWLSQFASTHQELASLLLDSLCLVSHQELVESLQHLLKDLSPKDNSIVGLFTEREVRRGKYGIPHALYKQPRRKKKRRAFGPGPQPVKPKHSYDLTVGSEGIIAWIVSGICKQYPTKFISHPSPDQIRTKKVRKFVLVTDMIGTGRRAREYLDSAWKVASVKSWKSYQLLDFTVVSYTGTDKGISLVRSHKTKPHVIVAKSCPTISTEFDQEVAQSIRSICIKYDPIDHDQTDSLGYRGSEVLLVFSHGCPNNAPRILFKSKDRGKWNAFFPGRGTTSCLDAFDSIDKESSLRQRLGTLKENKLATGDWISSYSEEARDMILVLAALNRSSIKYDILTRKTGLTIKHIEILIQFALNWGWIDSNLRLTAIGRGQLRYARKIHDRKKNVDPTPDKYYFPKSLRAPVDSSSSR